MTVARNAESGDRHRALTLVQHLDPMVTATNPMPSMAGALTHVVPWAANGEMGVAVDVLREFAEFAERTGDPFGVESVLLYAGVVRALAEAMGGSAWAESDGPGRGATFLVELPAP